MKYFDVKLACKNELPNPQAIAWAEANGLDPKTIPVDQKIVFNADSLTMTLEIFHPDGTLLPGSDLRKKQTVTVPVVVPPEDFGF